MVIGVMSTGAAVVRASMEFGGTYWYLKCWWVL